MTAFWTRRTWMMLAGVGGFLSVAFGAFAAHGVSDPRAAELLRTGANYGFMHVMATFACATIMSLGGARARLAPAFFLIGVVLFSGSLYAMALGGPSILGAITPLGGLCFLIGWAIVVWACATIDRNPT
ncbi:MAG: DUF423 domain-containing protein [Brevundimonas sp.]|nr:MAG: DUF423 domain-containing protein [Brevundimonas sp.]